MKVKLFSGNEDVAAIIEASPTPSRLIFGLIGICFDCPRTENRELARPEVPR